MRPARSKTLVPWLLLIVVALIAYGSLYPFNFKPDAFEGSFVEALRELSWARAGRGDRVSNVLLYIPLGFCLFLWFETGQRRLLVAMLVVTLGAAFVAADRDRADLHLASRPEPDGPDPQYARNAGRDGGGFRLALHQSTHSHADRRRESG